MLDLSLVMGACREPDPGDHDVKYGIETNKAAQAWIIWAYWSLLKFFSGGWTYIIRPGHNLQGGSYASIY